MYRGPQKYQQCRSCRRTAAAAARGRLASPARVGGGDGAAGAARDRGGAAREARAGALLVLAGGLGDGLPQVEGRVALEGLGHAVVQGPGGEGEDLAA
jgi:hypothetical protein